MGRKPLPYHQKRISIMLAVDTVDLIDRLAHRSGMSRSRQIQYGMQQFLRERIRDLTWVCIHCGTTSSKKTEKDCVKCGRPRE